MKLFGHIRVWLGIILALVFLVPALFTADQVRKRVYDEAEQARAVFGPERYDVIAQRANTAYGVLVVDTGLRGFIDSGYTDADALQNGLLKRKERSISAVFNKYLDSMSVMLYGLFYRSSIMLEWLLGIGLFLFGAIVDGVVRRRVKTATGGLNSPVKFTWAIHSLVLIAVLPILYMMLPVPVTPLFMPYWTLLCAAPVSIALANAVRVA